MFIRLQCHTGSTYSQFVEGHDFNLPPDDQVPIEYKVGEICGDQVAARKCYIVMLEMDDHLQTMSIEEQRMVVEPVEGLEEIFLDNFKLE